jgi:hypothetical protein
VNWTDFIEGFGAGAVFFIGMIIVMIFVAVRTVKKRPEMIARVVMKRSRRTVPHATIPDR